MFKQGDTVMYGVNGVCVIDGIEKLEITGESKDYYVLSPVFNSRSTLFVPTDSIVLTKRMHPLIKKEDVRRLATEFEQVEPTWIENENARKARYTEVLTENDRRATLALIKAAQIHRKKQEAVGKKLHVVDERFVKEAERQLREEASFVLNEEVDNVLCFLDEEDIAV